jgi:hypothetical protein
MLVACRLAGLSALEAHYADVNRRSQYGAASGRAAQLGHLGPLRPQLGATAPLALCRRHRDLADLSHEARPVGVSYRVSTNRGRR